MHIEDQEEEEEKEELLLVMCSSQMNCICLTKNLISKYVVVITFTHYTNCVQTQVKIQ
jgi:hypothetical protein